MTYLPSNPLGAHVAAFELGEYKEFLRLAREQPPQIQVELVVLEDLLAEYAVIKLPESREKWERRIGAFVVALGHAPAGTSAHEFFVRMGLAADPRGGRPRHRAEQSPRSCPQGGEAHKSVHLGAHFYGTP